MTIDTNETTAQPEIALVTKRKERISYYAYFLGQNTIYMLISTFLTTYLMFLGVNLVKIASVVLAVKIWDAVNDVIFGTLMDSVKFKSKQKFIPWLKISSILLPIVTILLFVIPKNISEPSKIAWFAIAYILWDTAYTLCDAPAFGLITTMTNNLNERNSILSYKSIWAAVGSGITYILATLLVSEKVGGKFYYVAIIISVIAFATMFPLSIYGRERYNSESEEEFTIKNMIKYLINNKYLLIFYLGYFFFGSFGVSGALTLVVSFYLFNNSLFSLVVLGLSIFPALIMALFVPKILKKIDKMRLFSICVAITTVLSLIQWFLGYQNIWLFIGVSVIKAIPSSIIGVLLFMFTPDCAEYGKYKTGVEAKGITFAIQTFMAKLVGAISGSLGLFLLGLKITDWKMIEAENFKDLESLGVTQSIKALNSLWFIYMLVPAIGALLAFIAWSFYKLKDKDVQIMAEFNSNMITREEAENVLSKKF